MDINLNGKRALVTGGNRGIGAAICRTLARAGAQVVINYIEQPEAAHALVAELDTLRADLVAVAVKADISDEAEVAQLIDQAAAAFGGLDILVNNAARETIAAALDLSMDEWDRILAVNLRGAFMCARAVARRMKRQGSGGVIVNIASIHDSVPRLGLTHYCVSKAGLTMLTKALALEWAEYGIRVVGVAPGAIETDLNRHEIAKFGRGKLEELIPLRRLGDVNDAANTVAFVASDAAAYMTGATLLVDGAYSLNLVRYDPRQP